MSISDAQRFAADLAEDAELRNALKEAATGLASVVAFAKSNGYDFSVDEAKQYILSQSPRDLTDQQLDAIAGGKHHHHHHHASGVTKVHIGQTVSAVTSTTEAAEVATTAVLAAEGAAEVVLTAVAVAVAAVVLT
ncbi:MAG: Nif11-like leader peptide family natural product precursor [Devosia sp.]